MPGTLEAIPEENPLLRTNLKYLIPLLLCTACDGNKVSDTIPAPLHAQPKVVELNTNEGYSVNTLTGDSIQALITKTGDTLITGIPVPIQGKVISPTSVSKPKVIHLIAPKSIVSAQQNVHRIPDDLTIIPINKKSLPKRLLSDVSKNDTSNYIVNSLGDTIKTGIPIPIIGKVVPSTTPRITESLPPGFKDAANSNLQYLDIDHGMISSYVQSTLEDQLGNLWFGTKAGVSWYDGKYFRHFSKNNGLSENDVRSIKQDRKGNLWFGTQGGGVNRYDGRSFTHFTVKEGFSNNNIWSILEDQKGNLWFGTHGGGVIRFDGEFITHFTKNEGLINNNILSIIEDKTGKIWFGTEGGVSCYDGESVPAGQASFTNYTQQEGLSNNGVFAMLEDKAGNLWFGTTGGGVNRYDGKSFTHFTMKEGLSNNLILSILEDRTGNIWFGTFNGGVNRYNGKSFEHFTQKDGLTNDYVFSILEDTSGNLWFGTFGGGVNRYDRKSFTHFTQREGLSNTFVLSILEDQSGTLWFGTEGGGVDRYDGKSHTHFTQNEGLSNNHVWSIYESRDGILWFGTYGAGVNRFDGRAFTRFTSDQGLTDNVVYSISEDKSGNLWFGTSGGLCKYNGEIFIHFTEDEGFPDNSIYAILEDKSGILWFGTGKGVTSFNGESLTNYSMKEGLPGKEVYSILEDNTGNLWFGTSAGLTLFDGTSFTCFTEKEGLSNDVIKSICQDQNGNLWLGTNRGISEIESAKYPEVQKPNKQHAAKAFYLVNRFGKNDGLKDMDFLSNSVCLDSKNHLWWGAGENLTMLNLEKFSISNQPPSVYLRQLEINEQYLDYRNSSESLGDEIGFNGVQRFENYPLNLELPYDNNHLTFHFSAIDWSAPHKIQYSYLMEGLNTNWSYTTKEGKADYRNLPYGVYKFKVCAIGESEVWSKPVEYNFTILPPWWHTWWARAGYVLVAMICVFGIVKERTRKLIARQKQLEMDIKLATKEIRHQKEIIEEEKDNANNLLLNILPADIAEELKLHGKAEARDFDLVSILFTDFKGFTETSAKLSAKDLVSEINSCFEAFDSIMEKYGIEKIKTIGDAYMAAGGLPVPTDDAIKNTVLAGLEMQQFISKRKTGNEAIGKPAFEMRVGIHSGPVVAGIVGVKKFQYDIWGDTVNTANRMESSGQVGKVNISEDTYDLLKEDPQFTFENRGKIEAKGKGEIEMYFVSKA